MVVAHGGIARHCKRNGFTPQRCVSQASVRRLLWDLGHIDWIFLIAQLAMLEPCVRARGPACDAQDGSLHFSCSLHHICGRLGGSKVRIRQCGETERIRSIFKDHSRNHLFSATPDHGMCVRQEAIGAT